MPRSTKVCSSGALQKRHVTYSVYLLMGLVQKEELVVLFSDQCCADANSFHDVFSDTLVRSLFVVA